MEEETFLNAVRTHADRDENVLQAVREILAWSRKANLNLTFETTTRGPQCLIRLPESVALLQMENSARATWLCITGLRRLTPFDREEVRDSLREKLVGIPEFSLSRAAITEWPRINLSELVRGGRLNEFIRIMDWMVDQWRSNQQNGPGVWPGTAKDPRPQQGTLETSYGVPLPQFTPRRRTWNP